MKIQHVNPFISAAFSVFESVLGIRPVNGKPRMQSTTFTAQECNVITGVTGMLEGHAIFGMSTETACRVAGRMTGMEAMALDELGLSALAELANMISGNAMALLSQSGITCDLTPPSILSGPQTEVSLLAAPAVVVPLRLGSIGSLELTVSMREALAPCPSPTSGGADADRQPAASKEDDACAVARRP
jgi:chemotaxis protein CheX